MITQQLSGSERVVRRLTSFPERLRARLFRVVNRFTIKTQGIVITQKLSGQVLKNRTGNLYRNIHQKVEQTAHSVTGTVYVSNAPYARIHEFGGQTAPHDILPKRGKALRFMAGGKTVFARKVHHPGSKMPERSFLRSALREVAPDFLAAVDAAVKEEGAA